MRTMYDACSWVRPPADAQVVAGYIYGPCAWPAAGWARFAHARQVRIATVASLNDGQVLDVERGDATPDLAVGWCARARARGQIPTVYCSSAVVPALLRTFRAHDIERPLLWVAQWDGIAELRPGWVAKQHTNDNARGYDVSVVADYWPGVDPVPAPPPTPAEDSDVYLYQAANGTIYMVSGGTRLAFTNVADVERYQAQGVKLYTAAEFTPEWNAQLAKYPAL